METRVGIAPGPYSIGPGDRLDPLYGLLYSQDLPRPHHWGIYKRRYVPGPRFSVIWFTVFGTLGMRLDISVVKEAIKSTSTALFVVLQQYPLGTVLCAVMALLIFTFLVTASNSATYVLGMYSEGGTLQPSNRSKIIWGALIAALAAIMMLGTGNGLSMLQTLSIVAAFPFIFIMLAAMPALVKALKEEKL